MLGLNAPRQYPRGPNPYGQSYAGAGANFKAGLFAGQAGTVMGPVAPGATAKYFAPIGEPHCIAHAQGGMHDGPSVNLAGWINHVFNWALSYGIERQRFPGMPINDQLVPLARVKLVNGVYQVQSTTGLAPNTGGAGIVGATRTALQ